MRIDMQSYCDKQWEQVEAYIKGVEEGTIITGKDIQLAVQRFREDVNRKDVDVRIEEVDKIFKFFSIINAESEDEITQFNLLPFQSFILAALFGPHKKGIRKYNEAFLYMARKNGKTTFASALQLYFLLMDGEIFPQSILVANTKDQSNRALESLQGMIMHTPDIANLLKFNRRQVYIADGKSQGFSETVAAKEATLQGYKLSTCILDEIHTYTDHTLYSAAKKGMSTKKQPMLLMISTAGDEAKTFCQDRVAYAKKVLRKEIDDDSHFAMLYMLDEEDLLEWNKEEHWYKANPALDLIKKKDYMRGMLKKAKFFQTDRYDFVTYDLNMYTNSLSRWITDEYLLPIMKPLGDIKGKEVYIGADFSEVKDLSSIAVLVPNEEEETFEARIYYIFPKNEDKLQRKGNINLKFWIEDGKIIQCQKPVVDDVEILTILKELDEEFDIQGFGYDKRSATKIVEGVKQFISELLIKPIQQGFGLSSAIKALQILIETKNITIEDNPVTKWNFDNVVIGHDDFKNWAYKKNKSLDAIDGVVALTNAYKVWEIMNYGSTGYMQDA